METISDFSIKYNPKLIEKKIYNKWIKGNCFSSYPDHNKTPYTVIMPPPNVTGTLHIGHILNNTIQDVLIRYFRMKGYNVCWVPGVDHASIATEAKIVEELKKKGISKSLLGKQGFLNYVFKWVDKHKNIIIKQLQQIGCSCDWNRFQFTMNNNLSKSVIKAFVDLYKKGYIYRKYHVVNWDPKAKTTISDEEIIYKEQIDNLYYIKYKIKNENNFVTIATTRPETIFGDTAICFNPNDIRYKKLLGKQAIIPIINRIIPIIQDTYVDIKFGTGCIKVTPAHDLNDQILAEKHNLEIINIFNKDATINEKGMHYSGMDRLKVRNNVVNELNKLGKLSNIKKIHHKVGFSERTFSMIEYIPSMQWFLKMKKISLSAINLVKNGKIKFYPNNFKKIYFKWMNEIHDWNISRQLWWGHRIPVYYYGKNNNEFVVEEDIHKALKEAKNKSNNYNLGYNNLCKDKNVLDTWFSSCLLPISVFDGINSPNNNDIQYYYPTTDLITGSDILFFWVARMIISGLLFKKKLPFKRVFFTGIIRDSLNKKISKSLNNSPNSTYLIDKYGADSIRMGISLKTNAGKDFYFDEKIFFQGNKFINKIWNSFRLIKSWKIEEKNTIPNSTSIAIKWLKNRFYYVLEIFENKMSEYKLNESSMILYKFFWGDFCSLFLEIIKPIDNKYISKKVYFNVIKYFKKILKLLHPYIPFISEKIWLLIKNKNSDKYLINEKWPKKKYYDIDVLINFKNSIDIVSKIRSIRNENNISFKKSFTLFTMKKDIGYYPIIYKMSNLSNITFLLKEPKFKSLTFSINSFKFFLLPDEKNILSDNMIEHNIVIANKKIKYLNFELTKINNNLSNNKYLSSVPEEILIKEYKKKKDITKKIKSLIENLYFLKKKYK